MCATCQQCPYKVKPRIIPACDKSCCGVKAKALWFQRWRRHICLNVRLDLGYSLTNCASVQLRFYWPLEPPGLRCFCLVVKIGLARIVPPAHFTRQNWLTVMRIKGNGPRTSAVMSHAKRKIIQIQCIFSGEWVNYIFSARVFVFEAELDVYSISCCVMFVF